MKNALTFLTELSKLVPPPAGSEHVLLLTPPKHDKLSGLSAVVFVPALGDPDYQRIVHFNVEDLERDPVALAREIAGKDLLDIHSMMVDLDSMIGMEGVTDDVFCLKIASYLPLLHVERLIEMLDLERLHGIKPQLRSLMINIAEGYIIYKPDNTTRYTTEARVAAQVLAEALQ